MQAVEGVNERWRVVLLSVFSFFFGRMQTGSNGNGRVVSTNRLGGVVGAVNELNGSTYRFFVELDSTGLDVTSGKFLRADISSYM